MPSTLNDEEDIEDQDDNDDDDECNKIDPVIMATLEAMSADADAALVVARTPLREKSSPVAKNSVLPLWPNNLEDDEEEEEEEEVFLGALRLRPPWVVFLRLAGILFSWVFEKQKQKK